jgi:PAS domain S-box-containing protein
LPGKAAMLDSLDNKTSPHERAESPLQRAEHAERKLAELLANIPAGYATLDRNWTFTYANEQAVHGSRQRSEEFIGKNVWVIWPELAGTELERHYRRAMEMGIPAHFEYYGATYGAWFEIHVHPIKDGISVYFHEITQRKLAQEALKASEQRYRVFTELNPQLILMADTKGQVTFANRWLLDTRIYGCLAGDHDPKTRREGSDPERKAGRGGATGQFHLARDQ